VLTLDPFTGQSGALWLIIGRIFQGIGAAFLIANSAAILDRCLPPRTSAGSHSESTTSPNQRVIHRAQSSGGVLGAIDWRLVFLVSVTVRDCSARCGHT